MTGGSPESLAAAAVQWGRGAEPCSPTASGPWRRLVLGHQFRQGPSQTSTVLSKRADIGVPGPQLLS